MESFIPQTPLAILITIFLIIIISLRLFTDFKDLIAARRLRQQTTRYVRQHNIPTLGIIIELRKTADTIMPLLDHLYEHDYPGLEVIVVVRHTAGKFAQKKLMYYRKKQQYTSLRIVKHRRGLSNNLVIRRYVSSSLVMQLQAGDRLLKNFFSDIAFEFLDEAIDVILPRRHAKINNTVVSAVNAILISWQYMAANLYTPAFIVNTFTTGRVYRRQVFIEQATLRSLYVRRVAIQQQPIMSWLVLAKSVAVKMSASLRHKPVQLVTSLLLIGAIVLTAILLGQDILLLTEFVVFGYWIIIAILILDTRGYSFIERLDLVLFAPLSLVIIVVLSIYAASKSLYKLIRSATLNATWRIKLGDFISTVL